MKITHKIIISATTIFFLAFLAGGLVFSDLGRMHINENEASQYHFMIGLYLAIISVVTSFSLLLIRKYIIDPINDMTRKIKEIDPFQESLSKIQVKSNGNDELTTLGEAINGMLSAIETERDKHRKTNEMLRESERSLSVLLSNLPGMAYRCKYDRDWTMLIVSEGCFDLTGYKPWSLLGNKEISFNQLIYPEYREQIWERWTKILEAKTVFREEYPIRTARGETKWVFEQGRGIYDEKGQVEALEGLIIDITDRKKREQQITYLLNHDILTGLYNRRYFEEEKQRLDKEEMLPLSVIVGDINGLKLINDAFGQAEGDRLICKISKIFQNFVRPFDILARTGGDEFSILMPRTDGETAYSIMKKIKKACEEYNTNTSTDARHVSVSLGCGTRESLAECIEHTVKIAESFMNKRKLLEQKSSHSAIVASIKTTMFERSQETESHAERLAALSKAIGLKLDLSQEQLDELELLATLHDIGKVGIDDQILNKKGKLTELEWAEMRKHPEIGCRIAMAAPELMPIAEYILSHHERWDGKGYPQGLAGEEIPLLSRIIAIVDAYDAMTEDRVYRKALSRSEAIAEIRKNAGTQFDPEIADIFIAIIEKE